MEGRLKRGAVATAEDSSVAGEHHRGNDGGGPQEAASPRPHEAGLVGSWVWGRPGPACFGKYKPVTDVLIGEIWSSSLLLSSSSSSSSLVQFSKEAAKNLGRQDIDGIIDDDFH
ncbi:hypothetical protein HN011_006079 [Eciton burchellii]|nr:hypothetical protein HN011_006079 [Eciton burchellii]